MMIRVMEGHEVFGPLQVRRVDWNQEMFKEEEEPGQGRRRTGTWGDRTRDMEGV